MGSSQKLDPEPTLIKDKTRKKCLGCQKYYHINSNTTMEDNASTTAEEMNLIYFHASIPWFGTKY